MWFAEAFPSPAAFCSFFTPFSHTDKFPALEELLSAGFHFCPAKAPVLSVPRVLSLSATNLGNKPVPVQQSTSSCLTRLLKFLLF